MAFLQHVAVLEVRTVEYVVGTTSCTVETCHVGIVPCLLVVEYFLMTTKRFTATCFGLVEMVPDIAGTCFGLAGMNTCLFLKDSKCFSPFGLRPPPYSSGVFI